MILVCILVAFGTFARIGINISFYFVLLGQFLSGCAACFVVNILMQFCYNWFHPKSRGLYVSVAGVLNVFGGGLGNLIPLLFVNNDMDDPDVTKYQVNRYLYVTFGIAIFNLILVSLLFQDKPPQGYG